MAEVVADIRSGGPTAVMLLHGQPGTAADWQWVTPLLDGRYTLIVPDRPGYGRTGGAATGFAGNARAAIGLLDRLGFERAVMVGHS
ncbi:MAG TPA: alpha/beta hydrolase, partial [Acidimicrobiales bacterium]|nr:alpha/beta hydrolase [Acidimicrobiales bacterium]